MLAAGWLSPKHHALLVALCKALGKEGSSCHCVFKTRVPQDRRLSALKPDPLPPEWEKAPREGGKGKGE